MTNYGVQPTGFVRKPIGVILSEIEAGLITEFGPGLIQTSQSPMGQINGLMADIMAQLWEFGEDVYQSVDVDQAEGTRLDILGRLRLLSRSLGETDQSFRQAITNANRGRVDIQDLTGALLSLNGVTYAKVFIADDGILGEFTVEPGTVAIAVIGGSDEEIAETIRDYLVPGVPTFGNTYVSSEIEGYCRSQAIVRPIAIPVSLTINVRLSNDQRDCPPPSPVAIRDALIADLQDGTRELSNGDDLTYYRIRSVIESRWSNVEVIDFIGERDDIDQALNQPVVIAFTEIAILDPSDILVTVVQ